MRPKQGDSRFFGSDVFTTAWTRSEAHPSTINDLQTVVPGTFTWHCSSSVTLVWLPPYSPEINPVERVWLYLREKHWSHRLLDTADAIVDALCRAWNALTAERLRSLTSYPYLEQVKI